MILPIGISFYTFEAINYTVDVYRRHVRAERNLAHFMLFITFFPHLVAGPIVRARDFLPQIRRPKHWDWARMQLGVQFFLMGLFKKLAIADRMALFVDPVFANPEQYGTSAVWLAVLAYALQIYCDFSGYTDMAIGTAHMLGYKLAQNFNMPYLAANISEFWRRWHISLSSWLRDYLFIPLGGSRGSELADQPQPDDHHDARRAVARGELDLRRLGHAARVLLIVHRAFREFCLARPRLTAILATLPGAAARIAITFVTVSLAWVFFRATTFTAAAEMFHRLFTRADRHGPPAAQTEPDRAGGRGARGARGGGVGLFGENSLHGCPRPVLGMSYAMVLTLALLLAPDAGKAFIYFQF